MNCLFPKELTLEEREQTVYLMCHRFTELKAPIIFELLKKEDIHPEETK